MKVIINRFDGGIVNDPRDTRENVCRMVTNFDILTDAHRLIPYQSTESGDDLASTQKIRNFVVAQLNSTPTYALYGLGDNGSSIPKIFNKRLTTGEVNDLDDGDWTVGSNATGSTATLRYELFVYYKRTGLIYGAYTNKIFAYDPDGGSTFDNDVILTDGGSSFNFTNIVQGLVHSKDDILYIPYDNKIAKNNNRTWTNTALTLPEHLRIRAICEYGNYIAIACEPITGTTPGFGGSIVYLWDRDATLTTLSESIYWGDERLFVLDEINGSLIGISIATGTTRFTQRIIFRYLSVSSGKKFAEFTTTTTGTDLIAFSRKTNNRLYFLMEITINGSSRNGVWSVGGVPGDFNIIHERTPNNDGVFTDLELFGFHFIGDYLFMAYADNAVNAMKKTTDGTTYSATSIYETTINPKMELSDRFKKKQLKAIRVNYEPLSSGEQVVLKYKVDGGSLITIFTETTANVLNTERCQDATSTEFTSGTEYEFRIESTGGAVITGLEYKYDIFETLI